MADELIIAIGIFLIVEGLTPALFPKLWKEFMSEIMTLPDNSLRKVGVGCMLGGLLFIYLFLG